MKSVRQSVGFADLTNWTRAAASLGDAGAVALLDEAYRVAGDAITTRGGTILKYIGDGIMFAFADASAAVAAAREIAAFRRDVSGLDVHFAASVATGDMMQAQIGHPSKRVDDVIGATVNRAGKLLGEAHRAPDRVAFCDVTQREAGVV
jgi:adenylate cyclase